MRIMIAAVLAAWIAVPAGAAVLYPDEYEWRSGSTYVRMLIPADDPLSPKLLDANWLGCCDGYGPSSFDGRYIVSGGSNGTDADDIYMQNDSMYFQLPVNGGKAIFSFERIYRKWNGHTYVYRPYETLRFRQALDGAWDRPLPDALTSLAPVPLPAGGGMLLAGLMGLFGIRWGRRSAG